MGHRLFSSPSASAAALRRSACPDELDDLFMASGFYEPKLEGTDGGGFDAIPVPNGGRPGARDVFQGIMACLVKFPHLLPAFILCSLALCGGVPESVERAKFQSLLSELSIDRSCDGIPDEMIWATKSSKLQG
ncbi:MAG: hypothetical protein L7V86_07735 [Verrucomicrobiales bacterium]|nr:hypothetical protein [Verrucomicrobiales bacterium]MDA7644413.1 hypothetical protein [Verrucomicrobiales bacterium]MDB4467940.1 hypothetical protein [Verrucomicrobiales bacterium]MDF1788905.1 hypothetical protein [Verrucomicrobiales bacterium]